MPTITSLDLFCRVVDNFGDIGVCWRLARQLTSEFGIEVRLFVDDLASFQRLCAGIDIDAAQQTVQGVKVRHWGAGLDDAGGNADLPVESVADVVIEAFGCALPASVIAAMARLPRQPVWINLEYLSAEPWVETCHEQPSLYPSLPLTKYFFFPGFTPRTGGLLRERTLLRQRQDFQNDPLAAVNFLGSLGLDAQLLAAHRTRRTRIMSLFCYPDAPLASLFAMLAASSHATLCLVPEGVAGAAVSAFLGKPAVPGALASRGKLTLCVVPFLDQPGYDRLLWSCDFNVVRGEDSLVRAIWAGRPLLWDIYPQEGQAHLVKLDALLDIYTAGLPLPLALATAQAWRDWSRRASMSGHESLLAADRLLQERAATWAPSLAADGDLASKLMRFLQNIG
ncbi:MAG: elongation factor P maturation arginine rhamnosyltransferase EarP [Janthinobacterium lividum]